MTDIPALRILRGQIDAFGKLPSPPSSYNDFPGYRKTIDLQVEKSIKSVEDVSAYADQILKKLKELKECIPEQIKKIQQAIKDQLGKFVEVKKWGTAPNKTMEALKHIHEMEMMAKDLMESRLNELIRATELTYAQVKDEGFLLTADIENLKGCLDSWENAKQESYEEEKKRLEEEKRQREEEERRRREEEERRRQEEEERRRREEEERRKREEEERRRREEEERNRREEEERLRREEEERLKREEEERRKREEEERRRREEEERKKREEEERLRKEAERQRREAERREKERREREEDERRRRLDPNNWDAHVYERNDHGQVPGRKPFHGGVCCMVSSPPGDINKDELECNASDELDDVIEILDDGEKPASSVISLQSKKGQLQSEVPARVYIPHAQSVSPSEELVVKMSVNGSDWITSEVVQPSSKVAENEKAISNLVGLELKEFESVKVVVVSRPKGQTVIVDRPGANATSVTDKNVKIFVPRDAFPTRTAVRLVVQPIPKDIIAANAREGDGLWDSIMSTSSMISITCEKTPAKDIEVDIARNVPTQVNTKSQKGKLFHIYANKDKVWKFADVEYKGQNDVVSVTLPGHKLKYSLFELELPANAQKERILKMAQVFHDYIFKTPVRLLIRQQDSKPNEAVMMLVRSKTATKELERLADDGFSIGPDISREFNIRDGQRLILSSGGNIEITGGENGHVKFSFFTHMNLVKHELMLRVKDIYKQKDLPEYIGTLKLTVDNGTEYPDEQYELTVALPKLERPKTAVITKRVRFPYYLTSLAGYLSIALCESGDVDWKAVLTSLMGEKAFCSDFRLAKRKVDENDNKAMCRTILCDWMKATPRQNDKVQPILDVLRSHRLHDLEVSCGLFVQYQKDQLSDKVLENIAANTTKDFDTLSADLHLDSESINNCKKERRNKLLALLFEWRESEHAVKHGENALTMLKSICSV